MEKRIYGYSLQEMTGHAAEAFPESVQTVYTDSCSTSTYPAFQDMMSEVQPGDQVVLPSISSLGPSLKEISSKWDQMVSSGADIQILDFDEVQSESFDQSSLTEIIRYLAKSERVGRKRRQRAGIEQARDSGVHLGRKKLEIPAEFPELMKRYKEGAISSRQAASRLNVTHTTFLLWVRSMDN